MSLWCLFFLQLISFLSLSPRGTCDKEETEITCSSMEKETLNYRHLFWHKIFYLFSVNVFFHKVVPTVFQHRRLIWRKTAAYSVLKSKRHSAICVFVRVPPPPFSPSSLAASTLQKQNKWLLSHMDSTSLSLSAKVWPESFTFLPCDHHIWRSTVAFCSPQEVPLTKSAIVGVFCFFYFLPPLRLRRTSLAIGNNNDCPIHLRIAHFPPQLRHVCALPARDI